VTAGADVTTGSGRRGHQGGEPVGGSQTYQPLNRWVISELAGSGAAGERGNQGSAETMTPAVLCRRHYSGGADGRPILRFILDKAVHKGGNTLDAAPGLDK